MKHLFLSIVTIVTILLLAASCYYDNEEALYPTLNSSCDTTNVTFSGKIVPMLANNCLSCHSNATAASAGNNIRLQDYADVKARTTAITGSIKHTGTYSPMPKNGGKLNACLITQFDKWVKNGSPNN
jgi:mono/diheme cytochrome c family protein